MFPVYFTATEPQSTSMNLKSVLSLTFTFHGKAHISWVHMVLLNLKIRSKT